MRTACRWLRGNDRLERLIRTFARFIGFGLARGFDETFGLGGIVGFGFLFSRHFQFPAQERMTDITIAIIAAISAAVAILLLVRAEAALRLAESEDARAMELASKAASLADRAKSLASLATAKVWRLSSAELDDSQKRSH
jgi:hypothetical protein